MTRRKEKLLRMIDLRMQQLIEEEEYEMCARVRDWRKEIADSVETEPSKPNQKPTNRCKEILIPTRRYQRRSR